MMVGKVNIENKISVTFYNPGNSRRRRENMASKKQYTKLQCLQYLLLHALKK